MGNEDCLIDDLMDWERRLENANLDNHQQFLRNAQLAVSHHPMEATAWENGFVPEAEGIPSDQLDQRIQGSLPPLAFMVSRPRQPIAAGEELLCRFDAAVRPYWLRDWQSGFGGYTKVYEYTVDGNTRRRYSVAHVVRPRTSTTNACLCFTLLSSPPEKKPWRRAAGERDPSRGIILDLHEVRDWKMPATVMLHNNEIQLSPDDDSFIQCLPVYKTDRPKWSYRKVPKVTRFRNFDRIPSWCRKPQGMTYRFCAENLTKTGIVPNLSDEDRTALLDHGVLPPESTARDRHCVMCPVRRGSARLLPCCLCYNWCHPGCSYQTHLGRICPCHVQILDPKRKIIVLKHPYYEDYVVLPTRPNIRVDNKSVAQEARSRPQSDEASLSRWSPSSWLNTLLEKHAWFSAGLVWLPGASASADVGVFDDSPPNDSAARPTISLFEQWEEGAHVTRIANARDYSFPRSLVIPYTWNSASRALSLSDALNHVSLHDEKDEWGPATFIQPVPGVNYPNQPQSDPSSDLSDPLTYWWGATLCPPELNDVSLAETVAIMMRYAALREVNLNTEVQKPSLAAVLEFKGATMGCAIESTPHEETSIYTSVLEGGTLMQNFESDDQQRCKSRRRNQGIKSILFAHLESILPWRIPGLELLKRKRGTLQTQQSGSRILIDDKAIDGISMENHHLQLPLRHTSRVTMYIRSLRGDLVSLWVETREQLNPIDFRRPIEVIVSGPDGQVTSDSHSRTTGVNLQGGNRLPGPTTAPGRKCLSMGGITMVCPN